MKSKFRIYLTPSELNEILSCLKSSPPSSSRINLIKSLTRYSLKIDSGLMEPAYNPSPRETLEDRLGFSLPETRESFSNLKLNAYTKYTDSTKDCTPRELELAQMYRYENDLLTPEEEAEFESSGIQERLTDIYVDRRSHK